MKREPGMSASERSERCLRQATRGLWGRRRREVREELEAHLVERIWAHRIGGMTEAAAVERALAELGSPHEVSMGMTRLYALPTVVGSGAVLAAACVLVVALLPNGAAQAPVSGTFYWPSVECTSALRSDSVLRAYQTCEVLDNSLWLDTGALISSFEKQGVTVEKGDQRLTFSFPGAAPIHVPMGDAASPAISIDGRRASAAPDALALWNLVRAVSEESELPISFEGWDNPIVSVGDPSFQLGTQVRPISGGDFYDNYLEQVFFRGLLERMPSSVFVLNPRRDVGAPLRATSLAVTGLEPGIYGVAALLDPETLVGFLPPDAGSSDLYVSLEVIQVDDNEQFTANLPDGDVRFVEAFTAEARAGSAMLVQLDGVPTGGGSWFNLVTPERISVLGAE